MPPALGSVLCGSPRLSNCSREQFRPCLPKLRCIYVPTETNKLRLRLVEQAGPTTNDFSKRRGICSLAHTTLITNNLLPHSPQRYTMKTQQPDDHADGSQQHRALFQKARDHLNPGPFFRFVTYFYAERKIAVFLLIHAVCTLVVWGKLHSLYHLDLLNQRRV